MGAQGLYRRNAEGLDSCVTAKRLLSYNSILILSELIQKDIHDTTILVQQAHQAKWLMEKAALQNESYYYGHIMTLVEQMIYNKQMLDGVDGEFLTQRLGTLETTYYIPKNIYRTRQLAYECDALSFPTNLSEYENFRLISNLTGLVVAIDEYPFSSVLLHLHNNLSLFDRCSSNYSMFLEEVNSWVSQLTSMNTIEFDFIFEEIASPFLGNIDWYTSYLLNTYERNEVTKLQLSNRLNDDQVADIVNNAEIIQNSITSKVGDPMRDWTSLYKAAVETAYTITLQYLSTFQIHFPDQQAMFRTLARQMAVWRIPAVTVEAADIISYKVLENETWRVWPDYMDIQYFVDNQISNVFKDIDSSVFSVIENRLSSIDRTLQDHVSAIQNLLKDLKNDFDALKTSSEVGDEFIL